MNYNKNDQTSERTKRDKVIEKFEGEHSFLSNFHPCNIDLCNMDDDNAIYPSVEHAFQAFKTNNAADRETVRTSETAGKAKRIGRRVELKPDWENVKIHVMTVLVTRKFEDPFLRKLLLDTKETELIEGNEWRDTFWGVCQGRGQNHLGKILMKVRNDIREEQKE